MGAGKLDSIDRKEFLKEIKERLVLQQSGVVKALLILKDIDDPDLCPREIERAFMQLDPCYSSNIDLDYSVLETEDVISMILEHYFS